MPSLQDSGKLGEQKSLVTFLEVHRATLRLSSSVLSTSPGLPAVPLPGEQFILGFETLAHTQSWKRMLSDAIAAPGVLWIQRDYQPQETRVRFLRDFCDLKMEGQQRNRARTHEGLFTRRKWNQRSRPRGTACVYVCNYGRQAFLDQRLSPAVLLMGGREGSAVGRCACVCFGPIAVFLSLWKLSVHLQESKMYSAWDNTPFILNPGWGPDENLYLLLGLSKDRQWGPGRGQQYCQVATYVILNFLVVKWNR